MTADTGQGIISLENVWFSYDGAEQCVVQDLSLEVPANTITAILGPNGSGKTTLLRLILGLFRPAKGRILLAGQPLDSYPRRERSQRLGLVPQDEHIPFDFTVLEYALLGRAPYLSPLALPGETDRQVALGALHKAGVDHLAGRFLPNLSGGERQLAVLARALAQQPQILLLDEPTAHLDLSNQGRLLRIMRTLAAEGATLVLTTHDPNLAAAVANHAVLMRGGQILKAGAAEEVLTAETLSATYGVPVQVFRAGGRRLILLPEAECLPQENSEGRNEE